MKIEVSNGELLDKITILQIKRNKIVDEAKRTNVERELSVLWPEAESLLATGEVYALFDELRSINETLWLIEDDIREKERVALFDGEFVELARSVYKTNDKRAHVKKQIDILSKSNLTEEKSYEKY
jgi:hypothetical protein